MILRFSAGQRMKSIVDGDSVEILPPLKQFNKKLCSAFDFHVHQALSARRKRIFLSFAEVSGVDSAGVESLLNMRALCRRRRVELRLTKVPDDLKKLLTSVMPDVLEDDEDDYHRDDYYRQPLGQILIKMKVLGPSTLNQALEAQKESPNERLGDVLLRLRMCSEEQLYEGLARQGNLPFVRLSPNMADPEVQGLIADELIETYRFVPLVKAKDKLIVACCDALNPFVRQEVEAQHNIRIVPVLTLPSDIATVQKSMIDSSGAYELDSLIGDLSELDVHLITEEGVTDIGEDSESEHSPVIRLVNFLLFKAVRERASDIHVEPQETFLRVRYRVDGMLYEAMRPPYALFRPIISRLKIMSNMDIAESRKPQDGRIRVKLEGRAIDFRVSTCPTNHGEKAVLRILDKSSSVAAMDKLGLDPEMATSLETMIESPNGILLTTGPTGSGKTTTLYAMLNEINDHTRNICTAEDPIEFDVPSVNQVQVDAKIGRDFASILRTFLRQDPDVIMVGEIRDKETAEIAIQAALTGHLVFSTLHTNNAPGALARLIHFGIEPFLIAASVLGAMAQRLVRRICPDCKELKPLTAPQKRVAAEVGYPMETCAYGRGCGSCRSIGYTGRLGLYELFRLDDHLRDMVMRNASLVDLKKSGRERGYRTLLSDGFWKVKQGLTTPDEIFRVAGIDL